jgi:hypothetical protein
MCVMLGTSIRPSVRAARRLRRGAAEDVDALPQEDRRQVNLDFIDEAGTESLLCDGGAAGDLDHPALRPPPQRAPRLSRSLR